MYAREKLKVYYGSPPTKAHLKSTEMCHKMVRFFFLLSSTLVAGMEFMLAASSELVKAFIIHVIKMSCKINDRSRRLERFT
jgi:hypothetical protein